MFDATTTPMQEMESNTWKLKESLVPLGEKLAEIANTILPPLVSHDSDGERVVPAAAGAGAELLLSSLGGAAYSLYGADSGHCGLGGVGWCVEHFLLPIIAVIAAVAAAIVGIIAIIQNWGAITEWFRNLWNTICNGIGTMIESVKTWFSNLWSHLQSVWDGICNVGTDRSDAPRLHYTGGLWISLPCPSALSAENCKDIVISVWDGIKKYSQHCAECHLGVISSIMGAIRNVISSIWDAVSGKVTAVV